MSDLSLLDIKRRPVADVAALLRHEDPQASASAGLRLAREAAKYGIDLRDYLMLAVAPDAKQHGDLTPYEALLAELKLPVKNDFGAGIVLQAASETFQTHPGTRALFPQVIDDMLRWNYRQTNIERVDGFLAVSRTVSGPELLTTFVDDTAEVYRTSTVPEGSRIPVRSLRTSEVAVRFFKHGSAIRTTYEFNRRASLDLLTPYVSRVARELELSKVKAATACLVNGDGAIGAAAPVVNQSSFNSLAGTATNGTLSWEHLLAWLVDRAKVGLPVDTVVGNWDSHFRWMKMFGASVSTDISVAQLLQRMGGVNIDIDRSFLPQNLRFEVSSTAPASKLIGLIKGETLEELREAGSDISEQETAILNQTVTYVRTQSTGYRLAMKDTRSIFDYNA